MVEASPAPCCFFCDQPARGACSNCGAPFCARHGAGRCLMCQWDRREALFGCLGLVFSLGVSGLLAYAAVLALRARRKNLPQPPDGHHERPEPPFDREP